MTVCGASLQEKAKQNPRECHSQQNQILVKRLELKKRTHQEQKKKKNQLQQRSRSQRDLYRLVFFSLFGSWSEESRTVPQFGNQRISATKELGAEADVEEAVVTEEDAIGAGAEEGAKRDKAEDNLFQSTVREGETYLRTSDSMI